MTQKILKTLHKISPEKRCIGGALLVALLIHLLMALLFGHTTGHSTENVSELPKVGRIVLDDKSNAELAVWMNNHDPQVMTAVDPVRGYSRVMSSDRKRSEPEDLPNLLQPVMPQKLTGISEAVKLKISGKELIPHAVIAILPAMESKTLPAVVIDGRYSEKLNSALQTELAKSNVKPLPDLQKLPDTAIEVRREADGTENRMILLKSCGIAALDKTAVKIMRKYMQKNSGKSGIYNKVSFVWRNVNNKGVTP